MEIFADRERQAQAAADAIAAALAGPGPRRLVATGGTSPGPVYDRLRRMDLGWADITVTLSDDRWVEEASPHSNARLLRERLLKDRAGRARFTPLRTGGASVEADALASEALLAPLPPAAATLLGMGEDGHIASLFPNDPDLAARLDPKGARLCVGVAMSGLPPFVPRISLTVRALLASGLIVLMVSGPAKRAVIERGLAGSDVRLPVEALLRQSRTPVRVLWAP